jgi:ActR/RegA family two-component response regulator
VGDPVDLMDPEYSIPGELDVPPHTGPDLARMRADSIEQRIAILEASVSELGRRLEAYDRTLAHMARLLHRAVNGTVGAESEA